MLSWCGISLAPGWYTDLVPNSLDETGGGDSISQGMTGFCQTGQVKIYKLSKTSVQLFVFHRLSRTFKAAFPKLLKTRKSAKECDPTFQ